MDNFSGIKELYDVSIRLNSPLEFNGRKFNINETLLLFKTAEIADITERKSSVQARGGYHNNALINWETDKEMNFAISHGVLSPVSWALLSNSKIEMPKTKSVSYNEIVYTIEDNDYCYVDLKYKPNHCNCIMGAQGNPCNEPLPMGRRPELMLKPLPPSREKFIFVYDQETGQRIDDFEIYENRLSFKRPYRKVYVDYTFEYEDKIKVIKVGDRLFNGFLSLAGKMSVKDEMSGEVTTAILEIPKIKLSSNLSLRLGKNYDSSTVSDFFFTGYPDENVRREKQSVCRITFLDKELTGDYI
jgi:hypothetical protein